MISRTLIRNTLSSDNRFIFVIPKLWQISVYLINLKKTISDSKIDELLLHSRVQGITVD